MNLVSRAVFATVVLSFLFAQSITAQQYGRIPDSEQPPSSMEYVSYKAMNNADAVQRQNVLPPMAAPDPGDPGEAVFVGTLINGYTSQGLMSNQLGYDWESDMITVIYRAGPPEQYPNDGNGMLVLNSSSDGGASWSGNSDVINEDLPSNIQGSEFSARHPSIYSQNVEGTTNVAIMWPQPYATFLNPNGVYGEIAHKSGPLGGPYTGGVLPKDEILEYFPTKMCADQGGTLYSVFESIDPDQDLLTGDYFLLKSEDNGASWAFDPSNPCLTESELEDNYQIYYSSVNVDVSPDGSVIYVGFLGIYVEDGRFTFTDNRLGYVRSLDGGATWSDPVMYPLYTWDMGETPVNTLDGWMIPSIGLVVDGLNKPHFLMTINGRDTFYPLDSTLIGEVTVNPEDPSEPPQFYALAPNILPDFRKKINPHGATGEQPTFSIWAEHAWAKTPDGMKLVAKWIDADSLFVTTPDDHPDPIVRDSTHDIFICMKDMNDLNNGANGWRIDAANNVHDIVNVTQSVGVDEKFTKMNPIINPQLNKTYFLYTILATGEFVPGQIYPDTDDQGPAELFFVPNDRLVSSVGDVGEGQADGFTLSQNFPNPFNPSTSITFNLPKAANVTIAVYNMLGKKVATAYEGYTEAGAQQVQFNAEGLSSGQYIYRLEANGTVVSRIMTLMK